MSVPVLVAHDWRRHRVTLLVLAGGMMLFQWLITRLAPEPSQTGAMRQLIELLPGPLMQVFGNDMLANLNARGALSFGYAHPFAIVLPAAWAVRVSAASMAGEIGTGTMDLIASRPVPRLAIVATALATLALGLAAIVLAGWLGTALGLATRPVLAVEAAPFLRVAATQWLLFLAFGCAGLLISATRRAGGPALGLTSALVAVSFALDYVARAWAPIRWLRPASLFMHFHPLASATYGVALADVAVFGGVAVVASLGAVLVFARRDL